MLHSAELRLRAMRHSAEFDPPLFGIAQSRFLSSNLVEDLCEFESIRKPVLAHESGDPGVQCNEINRGSKISWHCPFKWRRLLRTWQHCLIFIYLELEVTCGPRQGIGLVFPEEKKMWHTYLIRKGSKKMMLVSGQLYGTGTGTNWITSGTGPIRF
jgi:hypothetical protein